MHHITLAFLLFIPGSVPGDPPALASPARSGSSPSFAAPSR